jgi:hypothetical protein
MSRAARRSPRSRAGLSPRNPEVTARALVRKVKKGGFVQGRPWRYVAIVIIQGGFYHPTTYVKKGDYVFWVNMDERQYTLTFAESPFDNHPITIIVPAKEPGTLGNFGLSARYRVRDDAPRPDNYAYQPTAPGWDGPPGPPDIGVGD